MGKEADISYNADQVSQTLAEVALSCATMEDTAYRLERMAGSVPNYWKGVGSDAFIEAMNTVLGDTNSYNEANKNFVDSCHTMAQDHWQVEDDMLNTISRELKQQEQSQTSYNKVSDVPTQSINQKM